MSTPVGPYSPHRRVGDWIAVSGQIGIADGHLVGGGLEAQLRQALTNLDGVLAEAGASRSHVVSATVYLRHMSDFARLNDVWIDAFDAPRPARAAVGVTEMPLGALVEISAWAHIGGDG
ncbi:MAG TPA: Rid family hydrolase [Acidimicrobiales bacterium]